MASGLPDSGTHLLTYERAVSTDVFDGRVIDTGTSGRPPRHDAPNGKAPESEPTPKSGRIPLIAGIVMLIVGFGAVAYGLFGLVFSDLITAAEQNRLSGRFLERQHLAAAGDFEGLFADNVNQEVTSDEFGSEEVPILEAPIDGFGRPDIEVPGQIVEQPPPGGDALGRIIIPQINMDWTVVSGVGVADLRKGPGHMTGSPMPGQWGNSILSGHRTTWGGPFNRIDELNPGDQFTIETLIGVHTYEVVSSEIVGPQHNWVLMHQEGGWLTLTTCHPKLSSQQRLIVFSKLVDGPNMAAIEAFHGTDYPPPVAPDGTTPVPVFRERVQTPEALEPITVSASRPSGVASGDVLLAQVAAQGDSSVQISAPGWRQLRRDTSSDGLTQAIFWKRAGSEPGSYSFTVTGSERAAAGVLRVPAAPGSGPIVGSAGRSGTGSGLTAPGVSSPGDGFVATFYAVGADGSLSTPGGMTRSYARGSGPLRILGATAPVGAGGSGARGVSAGASGPWVAHSVVVRGATDDTTTTTEETTTTTEDTTTTTLPPQPTTTTTQPPQTTTTTTTTTSTTTTTTTTIPEDEGGENGEGNGDD